MFRLMQETPDDGPEVEMLYDLAFAPGRTALSSYQLRAGVAPIAALCIVARDEFDTLAGAIRYWPVAVGESLTPILLLGPVAIHPTRQGEGLGQLLIGETLDRARDLGWRAAVLVGDEPYYARFGFTRTAAARILFPEPTNRDRVLAAELVPGGLDDCIGLIQRPAIDRTAKD